MKKKFSNLKQVLKIKINQSKEFLKRPLKNQCKKKNSNKVKLSFQYFEIKCRNTMLYILKHLNKKELWFFKEFF